MAKGLAVFIVVFFIVNVTLSVLYEADKNSTPTQSDYPENNCSNTFSDNQMIMYSHVDGTRTRLRSGPSSNHSIVAMIDEGSIGQVIGSPVCDGTYVWWNIQVNGYLGWTTEYTSKDGWLLEKKSKER